MYPHHSHDDPRHDHRHEPSRTYDPHTRPPNTFAVDRADFEEKVIAASRERPILVDFWADWCSPCHALAPHLERALAERQGALRLAKVEVDEGDNMKLAGHYRLRGFPTVILFRDGEERGRFSGARSTTQIRDWLREHLDAAHAVVTT
jgi:thioredoxin 1